MPLVPELPVSWPSRQAFVLDVHRAALSVGLPAQAAPLLVAHIALSTGWGRAAANYRLAGIKATEAQPYTQKQTTEVVNGQAVTVTAKFRAFSSLLEGMQVVWRLLCASRYARSRALLLAGNVGYFRALGEEGWYTASPAAVEKDCLARLAEIRRIIAAASSTGAVLVLALLTTLAIQTASAWGVL